MHNYGQTLVELHNLSGKGCNDCTKMEDFLHFGNKNVYFTKPMAYNRDIGENTTFFTKEFAFPLMKIIKNGGNKQESYAC